MSLDGSSYVMVNTSREEGYDIQLRFKTTLPNGLLAIGKGSTFYILELVQGRLNLRSSLLNKWEGVFIGSSLNDTDWQKVFVAINSSHLVLAANEEQTIYPINLNEGANSSHTSFPTTYLGGTISYLRKLTNGPSSFIGCIQDAMINSQWVLPQDSGTTPVSVVGVEVGCKREAQCQPNPCHSGGHCTDLWRNFSCTCERPYLGHTCQYNLTAATFGYESINNSVVTVLVDQQARRAVRSILDISMFVRTREPTGGIFFLGSDPDRVGHQDQTIIATKLLGGELLIQIQFNGSLESYSVGGVRLDNGYNHFIQVVRNVTLVQVKINDTEYFRKAIGATEHLDLQILSLGNGSFPLVHPVRNFKGVIQDVQVSDGSRVMVVEFFPLTANDLDVPPPLGKVTFDNSSVLRGVVSDDTCRDEPCMHGGTCTVTWNDFSCICTVGHKGKQCQEMEFCQVQDCPTGSECRNLNHGYECVANITLHEVDEMAVGLKYKLVEGDLSVPLNEVSVSYRSKTGGTILQVGPDEENRYLVISVFRDQVTVSWDLGEGSEFHKIANEQANGDWANVWLKISNENLLTGGLSEESPFTANFSQEVWNALVSSTNITIGGSDSVFAGDRHLYWAPESDQTNTVEFAHGTMTGDLSLLAAVFRGCIGEVRVGGLLLPYFTAEQLNLTNASARDHFELIPGSSIGEEFGCMLCYNTDCNNGGQCKNATESYLCECLAGYAGDDCSENIDECLESDCKNNSTCVDGLANYTCLCQPGWAGTLCDKEIDECASSPCLNNGTCIDHLAKFECRCGNDYVGERCEQLKQITCDNQPCYNNASCENVVNPQTNDNFTCTCQDGFVGVYCKSAFCELTPCQNHGVCISSLTRPVCDCSIGFTGRYCETDIDDCASGPCEHGGACVDSVGAYSCDCSLTGFEGPTCASDIDECSGPMMAPTCPPNAQCINTPGAFFCKCQPGYCGIACNISDPCLVST
ncbi:hypothetical protein AAG570_011346 [Ranatra chinensis]|uniref:Protein crumbs n=1 Tax=Ranatra chinensis TaxID=642074 RepID=A0ABD0YKC7_9HEMI